MRDPPGDREPRRREYRRRFLLVFGGFLLAMIVIWTLLELPGLNGRQIAGVWMKEQQDGVETREQDCVAKAAYLEWAAGTTGDGQLGKFYEQLSSEWLKGAQATKRVAHEPQPRAITPNEDG